MPRERQEIAAQELAKVCAEMAEDRKADDVAILKVDGVTIITDYFVICTGTSQPHIKAICEWIKRKVRDQYNIRPIAVDGDATSQWIIIDFGSVVMHILSPDAREKYKLEDLWGDAERMEQVLLEKTKVEREHNS